jgi:HEAT repeat protein
LGEIADPAAVAALHAFAEPSLPPIAAAKLAAATRIPPAAALGLLKELESKAADPVHRATAFRESLDVEVGTAAERIARVLGGRDWMMKEVAIESIGRSSAPNLVSTLAAKLNSWDPPTQHAVIAALGRRRDSAATTAIAQAVKHQDAEVRAAAIEALGLLPGTRENAILLATTAAAADSTDGKPARQALARMDGPGVAAAILAGAERGDTQTRAIYIEQLALRNMPEALPLLRKLRADSDATVRTAAVAALGDIAPPSEEKALLDWTIAATDSAEQTRALRSVVNVALRNPDADARGRALFAAIDSASPELAQRLLPALARLGGRSSAETAARLALRDDASLAEAATTALARWTDATALTALGTVAEKTTRPETRTAATEGILRHFERNRDRWTPETTTLVSRVLASSQDTAVRKKLVKLLQRANDKAALTAVERLNSDPALAADAATASEIIRANLAGPAKLRASTSSGISNIMDGKTGTRWSTPALGEEWIEVDFKRGRPVSRITLDQTGRAAEFPEKYEVFVTDDPKNPGSAIASGKGQRNKTVIDLPAGTRGRYLIVKNVAERSDTPWAVCELYVD